MVSTLQHGRLAKNTGYLVIGEQAKRLPPPALSTFRTLTSQTLLATLAILIRKRLQIKELDRMAMAS